MCGQRFSLPEDAVEAFKSHVLKLSKSELKKTNTNDGRASKHSEYDYVKKMSNFAMKMSDFTWQHQKYARSEIYVPTYHNNKNLMYFVETSVSRAFVVSVC